MYKLFVALRYLRANKVIYFSITGVAFGIWIMILVTSVMGGFSHDIRARIRGFQAHLTVKPRHSVRYITDYEALAAKIRSLPHVKGAAPRIEYPVWMSYRGGYPRNAMLFGIDPRWEGDTSDLPQYFARGGKDEFDFEPDGEEPGALPGIVTGSEMGVPVGYEVTAQTVRQGDGPMFLNHEFIGAGHFKSGMAEYDSTYAFCHLSAMQSLMKLAPPAQSTPAVNAIAVAVDNYERNGQATRKLVTEALHGRTGRCDPKDHDLGWCGNWYVQTWEETRSTLLSAVAVERGIQIIMLFSIVVVAGFNIIAIYTMMVRAKTRDVGILRSLGATRGGVTSIFLISGGLCGLFGSAFGVLLGLLTATNLNGIVGFIRVASRELNRQAWQQSGSRGATLLGVSLLALGFVGLILSWRGLYKAWTARAWIWSVLTALLTGAGAVLFFSWAPDYRPWPGMGDPETLPVSLAWIIAITASAVLLVWTVLRRLLEPQRELFLGGFVRIIGTLIYSAFAVGLVAFVSIGASLIALRPDRRFLGWDLFPRDVYYLDRVPVLIDPFTIFFIVIATLLVSLVFSIYPASRAATYDPVEAIRHE